VAPVDPQAPAAVPKGPPTLPVRAAAAVAAFVAVKAAEKIRPDPSTEK